MSFQATILAVVLFFVGSAVIGGIRAIWKLRRGRRLPDPPLNVDFSMADLHEMLRVGQLTPAEFERAREVVLRNAEKRAAEAEQTGGHAFQVIQARTPAAVPSLPLPVKVLEPGAPPAVAPGVPAASSEQPPVPGPDVAPPERRVPVRKDLAASPDPEQRERQPGDSVTRGATPPPAP